MKKSNHFECFWIAVLAMLVLLGNVSPLTAQDKSDLRTELGLRQKKVQNDMLELETKLTIYAEKLREKEPERAKLLVAAYQQSKEQLVTKKMAKLSVLLDNDQLQEADQLLDEVIENLEALIKLLTQQKDKEASKKEEEKQRAMEEEYRRAIEGTESPNQRHREGRQ